MRRKNGLSLTVTVIVVALLAIFVGYLIGNWLIQIVIGNPDDGTELAGKKIIKEEIIRDEPDENKNNIDFNNRDQNINDIIKNKEGDTIKKNDFIVNDNNSKDVFVVQVGAFNDYGNALALKKELESNGFQVIITEGIPYKVQLGASTERDEAEKIEDEIETLGYNAFITH